MHENFQQEIVAKRNQLATVIFAARRIEMKAFLVGDRLIIDGRSYTVDTLKELTISSRHSEAWYNYKINDSITAFFGSLTNFHPVKFTRHSFEYHSSEQFLLHKKSILFKDEE